MPRLLGIPLFFLYLLQLAWLKTSVSSSIGVTADDGYGYEYGSSSEEYSDDKIDTYAYDDDAYDDGNAFDNDYGNAGDTKDGNFTEIDDENIAENDNDHDNEGLEVLPTTRPSVISKESLVPMSGSQNTFYPTIDTNMLTNEPTPSSYPTIQMSQYVPRTMRPSPSLRPVADARETANPTRTEIATSDAADSGIRGVTYFFYASALIVVGGGLVGFVVRYNRRREINYTPVHMPSDDFDEDEMHGVTEMSSFHK